jgi:hypothetical protein
MCAGVQVCARVQMCAGVCRYVQVCRCAGVQVCRCAGVQHCLRARRAKECSPEGKGGVHEQHARQGEAKPGSSRVRARVRARAMHAR